MKRFFIDCIKIFLLLFPFIFYGQISFETINAIGSPFYSTQLNALADLDNDGDLDIIIAEEDLVWHENIDGTGTFGNEKLVFELYGVTSLRGQDIHTVDMDGDSDLDVLINVIDQIIWIENIDGAGTFGQIHLVNSNYENPFALHYGDLDADGDIDVISANHSYNSQNLSWYENIDGNGTMGPEQVITSLPYNVPHIECADMDSDGDLDIVASKGNIVWYENLDGNASFSNQIVIGSPYASGGFYHFVVSDLDDDGDKDIIVPNGYNDDTQWYENYGSSFSSIQTIGTYSYDISHSEVGDFDGDGDKDVITDYQGIKLRLNNGNETFVNGGSVGDIDLDGVWNLNVGDIDNDGDLDILTAAYHNLNTFWLENDGAANFIAHPIGTGAISVESSGVIDVDSDGDKDIVIGSNIGIYWFENTNGNLDYGIQHFIYFDNGMNSIFLDDIDSDGDIDILGLNDFSDELVWFENTDGQGNFGDKIVISVSCDNPTMAVIEDIDGDGDSDVVLSSSEDNKIAWYANIDGQGNFSNEQIITTTALDVQDVKTSDLDGDGDMDIIVPSKDDNKISWYENTNGSGLFNIEHLITDSNNVRNIDVNDVDGDGDMDILSSSNNNSDPSWYENVDGLGNFSLPNTVSDESTSKQVFLIDIDNDNDYDVTTINSAGYLKWYENTDGLGNFDQNGESIAYVGNSGSHHSFADIDFDGDIDLMASNNNSRFRLYKNLGSIGNEINGSVYLDINQNDCQNNGLLLNDIMITTSNGNDSFSTFSDLDGSFQLMVNLGEFSTFIEQLPDYYEVSPEFYDTSIINTGTSDTVNFCITPNTSIDDLSIIIIPLDEPRPGFDVSYELVYKNKGTNAISGTVTFQYDDNKMEFMSATEDVNAQTFNSMSFDFTNLMPFESRRIKLDFQLFPPPTVNIDDTLVSNATITPVLNDNYEEDNIFELEELVIGSYDPNDITCLQGDFVWIGDADEYLHYLIRFQNTGTADAINVRVEQDLDSQLDWDTIQIESLSHRGHTSISNGSSLVVSFNAIHLPSVSMNEPESHGYIAYKIKPKSNVSIGDIVSGTAEIYFDFNPPIITNTANTEFIENLSLEENELNSISIFPNPTNDQLFILNKDNNISSMMLEIYNIESKQLFFKNLADNDRYIIDLSNFKTGLYFLKITTELGVQVQKIIKN